MLSCGRLYVILSIYFKMHLLVGSVITKQMKNNVKVNIDIYKAKYQHIIQHTAPLVCNCMLKNTNPHQTQHILQVE